MCCKNGSYYSLKNARATIRFMKSKGYDKLYPYFCIECNKYHLTSDQHNKDRPIKITPKTKYKSWKRF